MEDAPRLLNIPKSECPDVFGYVFQNTNGRNHGITLVNPQFLLNAVLKDTHWQASGVRDSSRNHLWNLDGEKYQFGNASLFTENKSYSYGVSVDDFKMAGKKAEFSSYMEELNEERRY